MHHDSVDFHDESPTKPEILTEGDRIAVERRVNALKRELAELNLALQYMQGIVMTRRDFETYVDETREKTAVFYTTRMTPLEQRLTLCLMITTGVGALASALLLIYLFK